MKRKQCLLLLLASSLLAYLVISLQSANAKEDPSPPLSYDDIFLQAPTNSNIQSCVPSKLDPFNPEMMSFYRSVPPVDCSMSLDWVTPSVDGSVLAVTTEADQMFGPVSCQFRDLVRDGDFAVNLSNDSSAAESLAGYVLNTSDHVFVECKGREESSWDNVITGIRKGVQVKDSSLTQPEKLNIMILGIDSMSRQNFARMLKETSSWMQERGAVFLSNYNVLGDGTVAALAPLLTGLKEWELPETRRRMNNSQPCDVLPFIWKEFKEAGYVTSFNEDSPGIGTFTYRLTGFTSPPTDHYMRPYYQAQDKFPKPFSKFCYRGTPRHKIHYNHVRQLYQKYPKDKKFYISWASALSHGDTNSIQAADTDIRNLLSDLEADGSLKDTLVMVMSDHGHRFDAIRNTFQGKLEERMPLMSFLFPPSFQTKYPAAYDKLKNNADKLTTALDIHATLKDLIELDGEEETIRKPKKGVHSRALSLFGPIPATRGCADAGIDPHWCACLNWAPLNTTSTLARAAAAHLLAHIVSLTSQENTRAVCVPFTLGTVARTGVMAPNKDVLKFRKSVGQDAESVDMKGSSDLNELWVQVQVVLQPGEAIFDGTLKFKPTENKFYVEGSSSVSRISLYKGQADCMEDTNIRPWCYCRELLELDR